MNYKRKYLKYKNKYLNLNNIQFGNAKEGDLYEISSNYILDLNKLKDYELWTAEKTENDKNIVKLLIKHDYNKKYLLNNVIYIGNKIINKPVETKPVETDQKDRNLFNTINDQNLGIISQFLDGKSYRNLRESEKHSSIILELTNNNDSLKILVKKWLKYENDVINKIGHISDWNVSYVTNMSFLFGMAYSFNENISNWNVSNVTDMSKMFYGAVAFNQPLNECDVSNVRDMTGMFCNAQAFNQPLNKWNVSNVTNMSIMFNLAESFNQDISDWDVSNVENMEYMFCNAPAFNQPLNKWNVSNVTNISFMFYRASSFNKDISNWDVRNVINMFKIFDIDLNKISIEDTQNKIDPFPYIEKVDDIQKKIDFFKTIIKNQSKKKQNN